VLAKIPTHREFDWGYVVTILQVPPDDPELGQDENANWDVNTRTIRINKELPIAERRWCYLHEMRHAWADFEGWASQNCRIKAPQDWEGDEDGEIPSVVFIASRNDVGVVLDEP